MKNKNSIQNLKSQSGSALILALMATALLGLMASATLTVASILATEAQRKAQTETISNFSQMLQTISSNPTACKGTGTGNGNGGGPQTLSGLRFFNNANGTGNRSQTCNAQCLTRGQGVNGKLYVSLDTNLGEAKNGATFPADVNVNVTELYLRNVNITGSTATGELMATLATQTPALSFAPRIIGVVNLSFDANWALDSCTSSPSPQMLCEQMKCVYNANAPAGAQRCTCGFPEANCPAGQYISGFDRSTGTAICTPVGLNCATTHGPGFFFAGVDAQGAPICLQVEGGYGVAASPTPVATASPAATATPGNCVWMFSASNDAPTKNQNLQYALRNKNFIEAILRIAMPEANALCDEPQSGTIQQCDPNNNTVGKPCNYGAPPIYYTVGGNCWECTFSCDCP